MIRVLVAISFMSVGGPAMAFDLAEFLATMSLGKPVTPAAETAEAEAPVKPAQAAPAEKVRPREGRLSPEDVWMIGVFR